MDNKNKQNPQSSANNEWGNQADKTMNAAEANFLNKQQELKELEASLTQKEATIAQREQELKATKDAIAKEQAELNDRRVHLEEMELQAKNGFPKLFEEKFTGFKKQLEQQEAKYMSELASLEADKEKLRQRELAVQKAEIQRDNGYADARTKLDDELFNLRKEQEKDLESKRASALTAIEKELTEERVSRIASMEKEIADRLKAHEAAIQQDKDELEQKRKAFQEEKAELDELKDELEYQKQRLQSRQDQLEERESNLNLEVNAKVAERKQSFESEKSVLNDEIARLRESIKTSSALISNFEELKYKLGDEDPAAVLLKLKTYEEEIKKLRDDLATRPTYEMQEAFDRLKYEKIGIEDAFERLSEENRSLKNSAREQLNLEILNEELTDKNKYLQRRFESVDAENNRLMEELKRLQSSYEREQDREARIRDIETPYIQKELPRAVDKVEELQWLDGISKSCIDYGLKFPRRILYAFHTALKTSEWSPMTVLAGVSGTGKSELPRLYSHFGGINFLSLSVQPNWDSQESMLGFFNSIDNKFDAQPVLRLLAQSQKAHTEDYPFGLKDVMSLILMDEMNLAHVELYFAEFLSKLELRRGRKGNEVPSLEVKLGAGIQHYDLPLGRNVLWAGTMNQDETTKSLSDKVLDRGIVINFPRPTTLERRLQLKPLGDQAPLLSRKLWESWWCRESKFNDDQILPFKGFIEEMNTSLSKVGRALGHRVWQSIEYYMANYPDVLEAQRNNDDAGLERAMKIAFEDQLVQKVMPKLRGIETRGKSKSDCLDKIRTQLDNDNYTIIEDFDLACEFGYGQFIWNSANYLKDANMDNNDKDLNETDITQQVDVSINSVPMNTDIPEPLQAFAKKEGKELWQLTMHEIRDTMQCNAKEAKELKEKCNQTKGL
ncbi:chromosome partitioning protein ParA [Neisseria montereyensis]|uniref:Chromosome partitioning protein ParA n=1 Tax=Neisseria montereyensis TaxID=2973938 RepID=A0ABT2FCC5_9NEIS|nr:chromosome partitioning protein ParA [Neisseria montereyensis]MCS4533807.1 chromosome partitioning protein ParA [Neisseria montereyensis]